MRCCRLCGVSLLSPLNTAATNVLASDTAKCYNISCVAKVSIDEGTLEQLQQTGELRVENTHGKPLILMTLYARQKLSDLINGNGINGNGEMTEDEMMGILVVQVDDPHGMGAPGMDIYDTKYGHLFDKTNGTDQ